VSVARRRFRFIKEIAEGGFGKVYLAEQLSADGFSRIVACKLLHAKWSSHDEVVMRTRDEARLLGLIRHQNIVKVEDLTSIDGKCAIIMEYLEGCDLKWMMQFLQEREMPFPRAALFEIMLLVASALDAAYNGLPLQGGDPLRVIHRDIKPSNIFVTVAGQVKVLDFGTARANFAEREAKTQALAFGSQGYMAPERMLGEEDTPAADVFSLGVTLWELLALESFGRIPPRPNKFAQKVEERIQVLPLTGDPEWAGQVRDVLRFMLSYEPSERPAAAQLVDILEILSGEAGDMPLRRFCRTLVAEAKANEPELDTGDPLTGQVVDEDVSSAFGIGVGGLAPLPEGGAPQDAYGQPAPTPAPAPGPVGYPAAQSQDSGPPVAMATGGGAPGIVSAPPTAATMPAQREDTGGGANRGAMLAAVVGVLLVLVVLGGGAAAVTAYFVLNPSEGSTPIETPPEVPTTPEPEPTGPKGCTISAEDPRTDVRRTPTKVSTSGGEFVEVTISGGVGFRADWDGKGECDLGSLPGGKYRTNVTPKDGTKIRGKTFEVMEGKKACAFTFDLGSEEWTGGCK